MQFLLLRRPYQMSTHNQSHANTFVTFEYLNGKTLEELLDNCLERNDLEEFHVLFDEYLERISYRVEMEEQQQPFSVKIPQIGGKLSRPRQTVVRIKACHKLIIGVGIIHSNIRKAALPCSL